MAFNKIKNFAILFLLSVIVIISLQINDINKKLSKAEKEIYKVDYCILTKITDLDIIKISTKKDLINDIEKYKWGTEKYSMPSNATYWGFIELNKELTYFVVLDNQNQLWFDVDNQFQNTSEIYTSINNAWETIYPSVWSLNKSWEMNDFFIKPVDFDRNQDRNNTCGPFSLNSIIVLEGPNKSENDSLCNLRELPTLDTYFVRVTKKRNNHKIKLLENDIFLEMFQIVSKPKIFNLFSFLK